MSICVDCGSENLRAKGRCGACYTRYWARQNPEKEKARQVREEAKRKRRAWLRAIAKAFCEVEGCERPAPNGWTRCAGHEKRLRRHGDPLADKPLGSAPTNRKPTPLKPALQALFDEFEAAMRDDPGYVRQMLMDVAWAKRWAAAEGIEPFTQKAPSQCMADECFHRREYKSGYCRTHHRKYVA